MRSISFDDAPIARRAVAAAAAAARPLFNDRAAAGRRQENPFVARMEKALETVLERHAQSSSDGDSSCYYSSESDASSSAASGNSSRSDANSSDEDAAAARAAPRTAAHRRVIQASTALSSSLAEEQEAASIAAARKAAGGECTSRQHDPFVIRTKAQAAALPLYHENYAPFSPTQLGMLQSEMDVYAKRKPRPWFIPKSLKPRPDEVVALAHAAARSGSCSGSSAAAAAAAAAAAPVQLDSASVMSSGNRLNPAGAAAASGKVHITSQRALAVDSEHMRRDWAEYRSCCGSSLDSAGMSQGCRDDHSSHSVVKMFKARLSHRARVSSREKYRSMVQELLLEAKASRVHWMGAPICLSCFRAVLGVGRDWLWNVVKAPSADLRSKYSDLTAAGSFRQPKAAPMRQRVVLLLRAYCFAVGQRQPNPKGKDIRKQRFFLPHRQLKELLAALSTFELSQTHATVPASISAHQFQHARKWLEKHESVCISLGSSIKLMRCATCDMFDNKVTTTYIRDNNRSPAEVMEDRTSKQVHLLAMKKQRECFDQQKEAAMRDPCAVWTVTLDGMDQSKTQLPSRARFSKDLEPLTRLKVHAIGAFCFGGPQPILGLLNFPDLRKDSSLSVVAIDRILDIQWERLAELQKTKEKAAAEQAAARAEAALQDPRLAAEMKDEAVGAATVHGDEGYAADGIGMRWPRRLHLTFDNAGGECKNQWMFRYLGLLVLHGVLQHITVSTLLVGHTHDIVDQLFSIWARMLRIHNAETYEKMRDIFRDRYTTRIEGLVGLMKARKEEIDKLTQEERANLEENMEEAASDWQSEAINMVQDFSNFVRTTFTGELTPHIELQSVSIDVKGWLSRTMDRRLPDLENIDLPHNFGIEKDDDGNVWLYNKHLADSTERNNEHLKVTHMYPVTATGSWTTRALLYKADAGQHADPFRTPPLTIDTDKLRTTAKKYKEQHAMSAEESSSFHQMLTTLDQAEAKQARICAECARLCSVYSGHGVVHWPKKADEQEKQAARQKSSSKSKAWDAMVAHLYDAAYADAHNAGQVHDGWWTKWLTRVSEHILPAYVARGYCANPIVQALPFHHHPNKLVSNEGELPCVAEPARVDVSWLHRHGIPRVGQMAVIRGGLLREPLYVAEISAVRGLNEGAAMEMKQQEMEATEEQAFAAAAAAAAAAPAAAAAAAAAATPGASAAAGGAAAEVGWRSRGLRNVGLSLKQFEVSVRYWDLSPLDFKRLHCYVGNCKEKDKKAHDAWWSALCAANGCAEEELQRLLKSAVDEARPAPPSPAWIVDLYEKAGFIGNESEEVVPLNGAMLVVWGTQETLFKKGGRVNGAKGGHQWRLRADAWRSVREDLTERIMQPLAKPLDVAAAAGLSVHAVAAAAAAYDSDGPALMDDQEEEKESSPAAAAAAAAAAVTPRQRPVRECARNKRAFVETQDDEEHDGDAPHDEDPEEEEEEEAHFAVSDDDDDASSSSSSLDSDAPLTSHLKRAGPGAAAAAAAAACAATVRVRGRQHRVAPTAPAAARQRTTRTHPSSSASKKARSSDTGN